MKDNRVYIIAEAGVNHNGSIETAKRLIDVAAECGADAVKFQTFKAESLVSRFAPKADYQKQTTDKNESQYAMLKKLELDYQAHQILMEYCNKKKIQFLSTPFDLQSLDLLANIINLPILKIPSGEITNAPLLLKASSTGKKIILSTGMSTLGEIETALGIFAFGYLRKREEIPSIEAFQKAYTSSEGQSILKKNVSLLHCTSEYPAPFDEVNLQAMCTMKSVFGLPVGLSDHTVGIAVPIAATALEAVIIEKHFTLDRNFPGPDHAASLEPDELKTMVQSIRQVEKALGNSAKLPVFSEMRNRMIVRKSIVAAKNIKKGEIFTIDNLSIKRPGNGVSPMQYWNILNRKAEKDYLADEVIQ